jgi:hypothetical protein
MVWIDGGSFRMGSDKGYEGAEAYARWAGACHLGFRCVVRS